MWKHIIAVRDCVTGVSYRARVLLYAIASRCNEGGWCRPTIKTLMNDTGMSRCGVLRAIRESIEEEYIMQYGGAYAGSSNRYQLSSDILKKNGKDINRVSQAETTKKHASKTTRLKQILPQSQTETPPVSSRDPKYKSEDESESKLVGKCGEGGVKLRRVVDNSTQNYKVLLHTPGWKPSTGRDRKAAEDLCYEYGSTREDASAFGSYNAIRNWSGINSTSTVSDIARAWVERFKLTNRSAYEYEQSRRASEPKVMT